CFFFFFSSRRRHTRFSRDWSSDVCSSDLFVFASSTNASPYASVTNSLSSLVIGLPSDLFLGIWIFPTPSFSESLIIASVSSVNRSEERRVGKECRSRWSAYQ